MKGEDQTVVVQLEKVYQSTLSRQRPLMFSAREGIRRVVGILGVIFWVTPVVCHDCGSVALSGVPVVTDVLCVPLEAPRWL